jgi:hypothetical protein
MQVSTLTGCELDGVPGFVPRLLRDPGIGLFRSDDRVFEAMLHGWRAQMLARGLTGCSRSHSDIFERSNRHRPPATNRDDRRVSPAR